jgi:GNAT superfamily N-acetyltransferase
MTLTPPRGKSPPEVRFGPMRPRDKAAVLAISARIWEGTDYLPRVFDAWVANAAAYFAGAWLGEDLIGCGRLMPFDRRRAWLEGLRVHPDHQGLGLGREMSHHLFRYGRDRGYESLLFSTYFRNASSIRISETAGFRPVAVFSNLELDLAELPAGASEGASPGISGREFPAARPAVSSRADAPADLNLALRLAPGLPADSDPLWNDWLYVPGDLEARLPYFPGAMTLRRGGCTLVLADNLKYTGEQLEICRASGLEESAAGDCLRGAAGLARERGCRRLHTMLPEDLPLEPWRRFGFRSFEKERDVLLYACRTAELRI